MLNLPGSSRILLYTPATDMRKSFRGLSALVYAHLGRPEDGTYYVFVNRRRTHVKIMYFDGDGLAIFYKRLCRGQFVLPETVEAKVRLNRQGLMLLMEGIVALRKKPRFSLDKR